MTDTPVTPEETTKKKKLDKLVDKVTVWTRFVDNYISKGLGFIGERPWKQWFDTANHYILRLLPGVVAIAGVVAAVQSLRIAIFAGQLFSSLFFYTMGVTIGLLILTMFVMHLAPKAISLVLSVVEKSEPQLVRPELLYIFKVAFGLGGFLFAICSLFLGEFGWMLGGAFVAVLCTVVCTCPEVAGMQSGHPTNAIEEIISLIVFPVRLLLSFFAMLIGLLVTPAVVVGVIMTCMFGTGDTEAKGCAMLLMALVASLFAPLVIYFLVLIFNACMDLYRTVASLPRKLDDVRKAIENK